MESHYI